MPAPRVTETILARGHENIRATHRATLEITKEHGLSARGDCIIAVSADKALPDMSAEFKENLRKENAKLTILFEAHGVVEMVKASGSPHLVLTHPSDIVIRRSGYVSDRTLAIHADKSANDLSRRLVEKLRDPRQKIKISLTVSI